MEKSGKEVLAALQISKEDRFTIDKVRHYCPKRGKREANERKEKLGDIAKEHGDLLVEPVNYLVSINSKDCQVNQNRVIYHYKEVQI